MPDAKWLTKPILPRSQLPRKFSHTETKRNVADIFVLISTRLLGICSLDSKNESFTRWGRGVSILASIGHAAGLNMGPVESCLHPWLTVKPVGCTLSTLYCTVPVYSISCLEKPFYHISGLFPRKLIFLSKKIKKWLF